MELLSLAASLVSCTICERTELKYVPSMNVGIDNVPQRILLSTMGFACIPYSACAMAESGRSFRSFLDFFFFRRRLISSESVTGIYDAS